MTRVTDDNRKRKYAARPSRRVANPMRTYAFKLGGKQADWLDEYIQKSERSASDVIRRLIQTVIHKKSGIQPDAMEQTFTLDIEAIKMDIANDVRDSLQDEFKRYIAGLLKDSQRAPMMHSLASQAVNGNEISEAEINNMLEGFDYE